MILLSESFARNLKNNNKNKIEWNFKIYGRSIYSNHQEKKIPTFTENKAFTFWPIYKRQNIKLNARAHRDCKPVHRLFKTVRVY